VAENHVGVFSLHSTPGQAVVNCLAFPSLQNNRISYFLLAAVSVNCAETFNGWHKAISLAAKFAIAKFSMDFYINSADLAII
jgi:hypothetical protein